VRLKGLIEMAIIVLDPGHGKNIQGKFSRPVMTIKNSKVIQVCGGAPSKFDGQPDYYREDFGTLNIALACEEHLKSLGHTVLLTRRDERSCDRYLAELLGGNKWMIENWGGWRWVQELAKRNNSDGLVSIHTNANVGKASGTTAFWCTNKGIPWTETITKKFCEETGLRYRGVQNKKFMVLRDTSHSNTCLLECCFHDNLDDLKLLLSSDGTDRIGVAIANGIHKFFGG
jgi:N-acetylmuramoyl-L-alanine amidase